MNGISVTFEDGSITTIEGKGNVEIFSLPIFHNVLFVIGLRANLLSISQFCDENHSVQFSKDECNIYNCASKRVMKGTRTSNNCYGIYTLTFLGCHEASFDDHNLYQHLGHINFRDLLKFLKRKLYEDYHICKQLRQWCVEHVKKENKLNLNTKRLLTFWHQDHLNYCTWI